MRPIAAVARALLFALAFAVVRSPLAAQITPDCQSGCLGGVDVTPDGGTDQHPVNSGPWTVVFDVMNTSATTKTFTLTCSTTGGMTCVSVNPTSVTLVPDDDRLVTVTYNVGATSGNVWLTATGPSSSDDGYYVITATQVPGAPTITLRNHNGDNRDQSLCLTSGAGEGAAWGCGDLVVTHGLPAYMTKGKARSLTLLYNSAQAVPRPIVAAAVNEGSVTAPTTVFVQLSLNGVPRDSATYTGWGTSPFTRQVVLAHDATTDSSGIYPFTLLVQNQYPAVYGSTVSDTLIVVNRATSQYGTGWSLVGVEELRLAQPGNKILWIGGDGSAKVFRNVATNTWIAAAGGFRDSLTLSSGVYTRSLRHGVKVQFDDGGRHIRTINRVGDTTIFNWSGSPLRLTTIIVPPTNTPRDTFKLTYDASSKLDRITDPAGRILDVSVVSNRLTQIIDPDTTSYHTDFVYDGVGRLTSRTNRRGFANSYVYVKGLRVDTVRVRLDTVSVTYASTAFRPWDEQGLATGPTGQTAVDTGLAYTKIDGPRTNVADTAEFWLDRWGAPTQVRDALGNVTKLTRGDAANPALVTRVQDAVGAVAKATYNTRGNLLTATDSTHQGSGASQQPAVTSYQYNDPNDVDGPSRISTPVDTTNITYNASVHLPAQITAQGGHITTFSYTTSGALRGVLNSVTEQSVKVVDTTAWTNSTQSLTTTFAYDGLGNDTSVATPLNARTRYVRDLFTRVTSVYDPLSHRTDYVYNKLNWTTQVQVFETYPTSTTLVTQYTYDRVGSLVSVVDQRNVTRRYAYDAAEQPVSMTDDVGNLERRYFGPSGLLDSVRTRLGHVIKNSFDPAGRHTKTVYPANTFSQGTVVPGDSILKTYDAADRLLTAQNAQGTVTYTYNLEGTVKTERQLVTGALDYTLRYYYDAGNRRTKFYNGTDTLRYTYGADGLLAKLKVQWIVGGLAADSFTFSWDGLGRRDSLQYSNGTSVSYGYDKDGRFRMLCSRHPGGDASTLDFLEQRIRIPSVNGDGLTLQRYHYVGVSQGSNCAASNTQQPDAITSALYDARHELIHSTGVPTDQYLNYDASGNIVFKLIGAASDSFAIVANSNRLAAMVDTGVTIATYWYDANGNRVQDLPNNPYTPGLKTYFYNAINQMVGDSQTVQNGNFLESIGGIDLCKYDAVGRRVAACGALNTPYRAHDGDNVIVARSAAGNMVWRFVQGPGLDDALVAAWTLAGSTIKYYYLTDGQGGQLAFTDVNGYDFSDPQFSLDYTQNGGNQAGGTERAQRFDNSRSVSDRAPGMSFYRNRYYDQATGRWLTEDPIGLVGGDNLYGFAGNNPVNMSDPFGLKVCLQGDSAEVQQLKEGLEKATGTTFSLDSRNCVVGGSVRSHGGRGFSRILDIFTTLVRSKHTYSLTYSDENSDYDPRTRTARVLRLDPNCSLYFTPAGRFATFSLEAIIVHELIGHGVSTWSELTFFPETWARKAENWYHDAAGEPRRSGVRGVRCVPVP